MAKKIYRNGKYTGEEILSEQEHRQRQRQRQPTRWQYTTEQMKERELKRKEFWNTWHKTNWVWYFLILCWPLGCYGIYKRYFKKKS